jgi:hypothetical protein
VATSPDASVPDTGALGLGRLRQFLAYARKVFGLNELLQGVRDRRKTSEVDVALVARIVFFVGLLRIRSFNALEPKLAEPWMQRALGERVIDTPLCSVDALAYSLQRMVVESTRNLVVQFIKKAERNKVFREGWHGGLRFVALDGWEPFSSFSRHCSACLTRQVRVKRNGEEVTLTQYYHSFVVAMLIDERLDLIIDMEPIRSADVRSVNGEKDIKGHEGELTAAKRLVPRLRKTYGRWIDALVVDALYSNGPFLTVAKQSGFGVIAMLQKETDEPLKDALAIWEGKPPHKTKSIEDDTRRIKESIELWDCEGIESLETYDGPIRVVRGIVRTANDTQRTWCMGVTGCATRLPPEKALAVGRSRWHIENTAFHQFTHRWHFDHVFTHGRDAIPALFWIFMLAFNMMQMFLYRHLCSYGRDRGAHVTRTISRLIDEMLDDLARLNVSIAWDTS